MNKNPNNLTEFTDFTPLVNSAGDRLDSYSPIRPE